MTIDYRNICITKRNQKDRELLSCCYCGASLEPLMLNTNDFTGEQRILWACRNMKKKRCFFPMGLPNQVFYVTRTAAEKARGFIPKPNIDMLPAKYRKLYPAFFADNQRTNTSSRCGTSMSTRTADAWSYPSSVQSPTTSRSSVSSDNTSGGRLVQQVRESKISHQDPGVSGCCDPTSSGEKIISYKPSTPSASIIGDEQSTSTDMNAEGTYSSTEASDGHAGETLSDLICDQLHEMGVDICRLEDEELLKKMAQIVKKLEDGGRRGFSYSRHVSPSEYRVSVDYLYNLDVTPIKRRLGVCSTDMTHDYAVLRSGCNVETMLDAIGGNLSIPAPPVKRPRTAVIMQELRKRVDAVLKTLAESRRDNQNEVSATADTASSDVNSSETGEWYDEGNGPSTSTEMASSHNAITPSTEQERLNAIVENRVRTQIANSAARRRAYRQKRIQRLMQQDLQPTCAQDSLPPNVDGTTSADACHVDDELLSLASAYPNSREDVSEAILGNRTESRICEGQLTSRGTDSDDDLHSDTQSIVDIEFGLFDDLIY
ncbi:hypothetical protein KIN20_038375 [Parelaphostrongylus tenuis]|uniref:Uncharacterized protein n=1 Tax=Parelaphostrongylus tenuis TaxID=148309 RepID=A0AAD5QBZ4_PARTN|nr:hypothetical protein KIN20_038375 [Parelaphostrongylus tenuis]